MLQLSIASKYNGSIVSNSKKVKLMANVLTQCLPYFNSLLFFSFQLSKLLELVSVVSLRSIQIQMDRSLAVSSLYHLPYMHTSEAYETHTHTEEKMPANFMRRTY